MDTQSLLALISLGLVLLSHTVYIAVKFAKVESSVQRLLDELLNFNEVQKKLNEHQNDINLLKQAKELGH